MQHGEQHHGGAEAGCEALSDEVSSRGARLTRITFRPAAREITDRTRPAYR